jgi:hypothetical protein
LHAGGQGIIQLTDPSTSGQHRFYRVTEW